MWSVKEAAKELNISVAWVRKLLAEGMIKGKKVGNYWVVLELSYQKKKRKKK